VGMCMVVINGCMYTYSGGLGLLAGVIKLSGDHDFVV